MRHYGVKNRKIKSFINWQKWQLLSAGLMILVFWLLISLSMAAVILFFHSQKFLMPLLEKGCFMCSFETIDNLFFGFFQDILAVFLCLGILETSLFSLALDVISRSPVTMCWLLLWVQLGSNLVHVKGTVLGFYTNNLVFRNLANAS